MSDDERLRRVLGIPAWAWLRQRLRRHLEAGRPLPRRLQLRDPEPAERRAANELFATPGATGPVTVVLARLLQILREAALPDDLPRALTICDGPLIDRPAERRAHQARWAAIVADCLARLPAVSQRAPALAEPATWQRLSAGDADQAAAWIDDLVALARFLDRPPPEHSAWLLQELAVQLAGDAHALDRGRGLGRLAAWALAGCDPRGADPLAWRAAWAAVGVQVPQTTAPVLALGLRWQSGPFSEGWNAHAAAGEPLRLTSRAIASARLAPLPLLSICENPGIVEAAADRLGHRCPPLICLDGQPTTAALLLLDAAVAAGASLRYHGDFDWPGLAIANHLRQRFPQLQPWRYRNTDLAAAAQLPGPPLQGEAVAASWDPALAEVLTDRGCALHEEAVLQELLDDLDFDP